MDKDVTNLVNFGSVDDESLPLTKCICGETWSNWSGPILSIYPDPDLLQSCPICSRKYYFRNEIKVYLVE